MNEIQTENLVLLSPVETLGRCIFIKQNVSEWSIEETTAVITTAREDRLDICIERLDESQKWLTIYEPPQGRADSSKFFMQTGQLLSSIRQSPENYSSLINPIAELLAKTDNPKE